MTGTLKYLAGIAGPSGYGSKSTAEQVTHGCSSSSPLTAIVTAEAYALISGLQEAIRLKIKKIEIEGNNLCVIKALQGLWSFPWEIEMIISDSRLDLLSFEEVHIRHVFREINCVADRLTHLGISNPNTNFSDDPELRVLIRKDALGATSGIGVETARVLAKRGVRVVLPARNLKKAAEVKDMILKETPTAEIIILEIDLSSFASVTRFCSQFLSLGLPLNILINNAGVFSRKLEFSEDKIEMTFATNYVGHFLMTELLIERMIETAEETGIEGRIVNVSSVIHTWVQKHYFCFTQLLNPINYNGTRAYAQSKLATILHAKQMATQLKARNARVSINAVHPGIVKTGIIRAHKGFITDSLFFLASKLLKSTSQGAATTCYVALTPQALGITGSYFADCNETACSLLADDPDQAQSLWQQTRALIYKRLNHQPQPQSSTPR